jgi:hypothetical protein
MTKNNFLASAIAVMATCGLLVAPACRQQPQSRQSEENSAPATAAPLPTPSGLHAQSWHWEKPRQWLEEGSSGLRLATFSFAERKDPGQCTLVSLPGDGGGVQANVQRWLAQMQLPQFSPQELADFLKQQKTMRTGSGLPVTIIDFTALGRPPEPAAMGMLAAIINGENQTLFAKISGERSLLKKNKDIFLKFCQSVSQGG